MTPVMNIKYIMSYDGLVYYLMFILWLRSSVLFNRTNIIHMTRVMNIKYIMSYDGLVYYLMFI